MRALAVAGLAFTLTAGCTTAGSSSSGNGGTASSSSGTAGGSSQGNNGSSAQGGSSRQSSSETGPIICPAQSSSSSSSGGFSSGGSTSMPPSWDCLGTVCWGAPPEGVTQAPITVRAVDHLQSTNVPDVTIKLCGEGDTACATPVATVVTDSFGRADLTIPLHPWHGFRGHLELTGADKVPTIVHLNPPIVGNTPQWQVGVFNLGQLDLVARIAGAEELKPSRGHIGALVEDCAGNPSSGVVFSLDNVDEFTSWAYLINNIPDNTATQTDRTGAVGFFNARPGVAYLTATRIAGSQFIGRVPVLIREGWVTTLVVPPTPGP